MDDEEAIQYLRRRRSSFFFGDPGPRLPAGTSARWRLTPADPRGWHANMVGFVEAPMHQLRAVLDIARGWFDDHRTDTWLDVDERSILFEHQDLVAADGFRLRDNWDAMCCRRIAQPPRNPEVTLRPATDEAALKIAAWIAARYDAAAPIGYGDVAVRRRLRRYLREYAAWNTRFIVAYLMGEPVGAARLTDEELPVIVGVVTLPEARGRGVATAITAALAERAVSEHGACALYVERDSQAQRIYRRLGFEPLFRAQAWHRGPSPPAPLPSGERGGG